MNFVCKTLIIQTTLPRKQRIRLSEMDIRNVIKEYETIGKTMNSDKITAGAFVLVHGAGHNSGITKHAEDYQSGIPTGVMSSGQRIYDFLGRRLYPNGAFKTFRDFITYPGQDLVRKKYRERFNSPRPRANLPVVK